MRYWQLYFVGKVDVFCKNNSVKVYDGSLICQDKSQWENSCWLHESIFPFLRNERPSPNKTAE